MKIALVGLPSSGKSSIINSLIGKRMAQSGVSRTTTKPTLYTGLVSDDSIQFDIYDLPGLADIDDSTDKFDTMIYDTIPKCNLVFWVSDINKAFLTNHELDEFNKLKEYIGKISAEKGIGIQLSIILSKMDRNIDHNLEITNSSNIKLKEAEKDTINEYVCNSNLATELGLEIKEDTTVLDIYTTAKTKFVGTNIICFNAYGRSVYHSSASPTLKKFASQYYPVNINISFNLDVFHTLMPIMSDSAVIQCFVDKFKTFIKDHKTQDWTRIDTHIIQQFELFAQYYMDSFNRLHTPDAKKILLNIILHGGKDNPFFRNEIYGLTYYTQMWNILCIYINLDISAYVMPNKDEMKLLSCYQLYRLIQIGKDYSNEYKLSLYLLDNCKSIELYNNILFIKANIYDLKYYLSGLVFKAKDVHNANNIFNNCMYTKLIYNKHLLTKVKEIRSKVFGPIEDTIDIAMLPIAYEKYGLFWKAEVLDSSD